MLGKKESHKFTENLYLPDKAKKKKTMHIYL